MGMIVLTGLLVFSGCALFHTGSVKGRERSFIGAPLAELSVDTTSVISKKHASEKTPGGKVLAAANKMVKAETVVIGGCWDYINAVYNKAGFPGEKRKNIFMEKESGPFADPALLDPGDWVMYKNLPYGEIGHSAIFVEWIDFSKRSALTIEYVGANRAVPGRFREADLTKTWGIIRAEE
jgi:hypothetical protein